MNDLISRKAAIDTAGNTIPGDWFDILAPKLEELPSAQPVARDMNVLSNDLISRQTAIDAIEEYTNRLQMVDWKENPGVPYKAYALNWCINTIRDLPSAQPERKKGRWVRITQGAIPEKYMCPFCHRTIENDGVESLLSMRFPFCHCGADMREGEQNG